MKLVNSRSAFRTRRRPRRRTRPLNKPEDEGRCAEYDDEYEC